MTVLTNIIIYLFSKIKTVGGRSCLTKTRTIFIAVHSFAYSYTYITHSSICQVFVTNTTFAAFPSLVVINNSSQTTFSLLSNITALVNDQISFLECVKNRMSVYIEEMHFKIFLFFRISLNIQFIHKKWIRLPPKSLIQI